MAEIPSGVSSETLQRFLLAMADDELVLGHRNSEWTGHAPILEEDIAFSNIAQDELGHSLLWYTLLEKLNGKPPDSMAFDRPWKEFTCCRFVTYPRGDFAYTVVRQYLFDEAEQVRLTSLSTSSYAPLREVAEKLLCEEAYHLMHLKSLLVRLGSGTEGSHRRMQSALDACWPQALGMFEVLDGEADLVSGRVFQGNTTLAEEWKKRVQPILASATLRVPTHSAPDLGGRFRKHTDHLKQLVNDLQSVYQIAPEAKW